VVLEVVLLLGMVLALVTEDRAPVVKVTRAETVVVVVLLMQEVVEEAVLVQPEPMVGQLPQGWAVMAGLEYSQR
jgi:hypothetical protein